jgi:drug/metabolite transporter (DMT)-like permease
MADLTAPPPRFPAERTINAPDRVALGVGLRLASVLMLCIMMVFVKLSGQNGVHVAESVFWRQLAGLPAVTIWLMSSGEMASIKTTKPGMHAWRMALGLSGMLLNFLGVIMLPLAQATTIGFAAPIFATLFAAILLREPTGKYRWAAILAGFAGVVIAIGPSRDVAVAGSLIALGGAFMTAAVSIQLRRMARTERTGAIVFWFSLFSLIPLGAAMPFFASGHNLTTWIFIGGASISGAIAQILLTSSLRHAPVAVILTMDYSSLIWATLFGFLVFGDIPHHAVWIGAPIVVASGLLIAWRERYLSKVPVSSA